ncbi:hypothetical protein ACFX1X_002397 [Malus domestica]
MSKALGLTQGPGEVSGKSHLRLVRKGDLLRHSSTFEVTRASIPGPEQRAKTTAVTTLISAPAPENLLTLSSEVAYAVTTESVRDVPPASSTTFLPDLHACKIFKDWIKKGLHSFFQPQGPL